MKRRFLATAFAISSICTVSMRGAMAQTAVEPVPGADYRINRFVSPATGDGETSYFLRCDNGTTRRAYDWNGLCHGGRPLNADMLKGTGGKEPAFIRDKDGTPWRMFVCAAPRGARLAPSGPGTRHPIRLGRRRFGGTGKAGLETGFDGIEMSSYKGNRRILKQ